jgi:hypothetical protein
MRFFRLFFTSSQIPELAAFKPDQRQWLKSVALKNCRETNRFVALLPMFSCCIGGVLGWIGLPLLLANLDVISIVPKDVDGWSIYSMIGGASTAATGGWLGNLWLHRKLWPYVQILTTDSRTN